MTAAVRCVVQLALVATLLQKVFEADNAWAVGGIACEEKNIVSRHNMLMSTLTLTSAA